MTYITRIERIIAAKNILPADQRRIYDDLFVKLKSEDQVCRESGMTMMQLVNLRDELVRSLRAVSA